MANLYEMGLKLVPPPCDFFSRFKSQVFTFSYQIKKKKKTTRWQIKNNKFVNQTYAYFKNFDKIRYFSLEGDTKTGEILGKVY